MNKLGFEDKTETIVKLEGKVVGTIKEVKSGWQYFPKGSKTGGEIFTSKFTCMHSLYYMD